MSVAKKKSRNGKATKKTSIAALWKLGEERLTILTKQVDDEFKLAKQVYDEQDDETQESIDRIHETLMTVGAVCMWVSTSRTGPRHIVYYGDELRRKMNTVLAVNIVRDLAQMDIQVSDFKFTKTNCASCNKPIKGKR